MIMYKFVLAVYIDEKDTEKLMELCEKNNFDLSEKVKSLLEDWTTCDFETISTTTILQCVAICIKNACNNKTILRLDKQDFIEYWDSIVKSMNAAVDFFKNTLVLLYQNYYLMMHF